jgi:hypothetical protein
LGEGEQVQPQNERLTVSQLLERVEVNAKVDSETGSMYFLALQKMETGSNAPAEMQLLG